MESLDSLSTVEWKRRLWSYSLLKGGHHEDPYVKEILDEVLDSSTKQALGQYTRGMYTLDLHYSSFLKYARPLSDEVLYADRLKEDPFIQKAIKIVEEQLAPIFTVPVWDINNVDNVFWWPNTSAGWGYIGKKRDNYALATSNAYRALYDFGRFGNEYRFVPDKAFARSQLALRANPKIRHVWGRAFHNILIEGLTAQPIIERAMSIDTPIYIGRDLHKDLPFTIIRQLRDDNSVCYGLDFSAFDARMNSYLVEEAFNMIERHIQTTNYQPFYYARNLFQRTPVVMPDGNLYIVKTGIPSGSMFTQLIGSITNLVLIYAVQLRFLGRIYETYVLGDDSLFAMEDALLDISEAADWLSSFGQVLNQEKTILTRKYSEIVFLGHNFYGSSVTRDDFTCLSLALFTEDDVLRPSDTAVRLSSLLYDSGCNSYYIYDTYKLLLSRHNIDWSRVIQRPVDRVPPFGKLLVLSI
jgi:hypothetical protein